MPNWCSTAYAIDGDAKEVRQLYELMKGLEERDSPSVKNDFGTTWLGCLVDALGGDWKKIKCRGDWSFLELDEDDDIVRFCTETAWYPCNEVLEFVCKKFPSLNYYCQAEEPGQNIYITNDNISTKNIWLIYIHLTNNVTISISLMKKKCMLGLNRHSQDR